MRLFYLLISIILLLLGVSFAALNAETVSVNLYVTVLKMPISVMIVLSMGFGMIIGFLLLFFKYLNVKNANRKLNNKMKVAEKEVENLRAIPLQDKH